ncbi:MAG: CotH kinase family protein [Clostridia bacterium]|nr:CotH kinase family protein [Clostridia bacterium]
MKRFNKTLIIIISAVLLSCAGCTGGHAGDANGKATSPAGPATGEPANDPSGPVPAFSQPGGIYDIAGGAVQVALMLPDDAPAGAYITYTENGDEPRKDSQKYSGELTITATTVLRAAVFDAGGAQLGPIATNTYIVNEAGTLRVVALAVDTDDLYSAKTGIFANRSGTGAEWERPVSVEIYEPDGTGLVHQDAGIRLAGSGSRSFDPASLRLIARKTDKFDASGIKYGGSGKFRADLFGTGFAEYDRFLLRNGGNDSPYQARTNFLRMNLLRDCVANEYCAGLAERLGISVFAQRCVPVSVYLNGEYYGMAIMKEDFDERLLAEQYGLVKDNITVIKGKKLYYQLESGAESELESWLALCEYAIDHALDDGNSYTQAYAYVSEQIDLDNAAAYLAAMLYLCNTDWPQNNAMAWRYTGAASTAPYSDGKWRFVIRDMDLCFALHDEPSRVSKTTYSMADTDTFYRLLVFYRDGNGYSFDQSLGLYGDDMKLQGLFDFLLRSPDFRTRFRAVCDVLSSDAEAGYMIDLVNSFKALTQDEMRRHIDVWKSRGKIFNSYSFSRWEKSFDGMLEFISDRPRYFNIYLNDALKYYE